MKNQMHSGLAKKLILSALLAGASSFYGNAGIVAAEPIAATDTVTTSNTADTPYTSITVDGMNIVYGISNDSVPGMHVYLADDFTQLKVTGNGNDNNPVNVYGVDASRNTYLEGKQAAIVVEATSNDNEAWAGGLCVALARNQSAGNINITATAKGPTEAEACGLYADRGENLLTGNVTIKTKATTTDGNYFKACSMYINSPIDTFYNLRVVRPDNCNNLSSTGTTKILEGDLYVAGYGTNRLTMDTAGSYLQGNISNMDVGGPLGLNIVKISNGAVWRPVFDNRYGTDCQRQLYTFYYMQQYKPASYKVAERATQYLLDGGSDTGTVITLGQDGIIDLTWDGWKTDGTYDTTRSYRTSKEQTEKFRKLTIANITGADGILKIDSDLANNQADQLVVGADSTITSLKVQVNYDDFYKDSLKGDSVTGKALVVTDNSADQKLKVVGTQSEYNEKLYAVTVAQDETETNKWNLVKIEDLNGTKPEPTPTPVPNYITENTKHAADARDNVNNIWFVEMNSLRKRLGDLRSMEKGKEEKHDNIWAKYGHGTQNIGNDRDTEIKYNQFQIGYDKAFPQKNGKTYRGILVSRINGDASYERGSGDTNSTTVGLYQTWLGNKGHYYDIVLKAGKINTDYNVVDLGQNYSEADYSVWGTELSGEYGYKKTWGNGAYFEPSAELILSHMGSGNYTTSKDMDVYLDATKYAITRLGFTLGKEFNKGNAYFKGNYYHDFAGGAGVTTGSISYEADHAENWWEFGFGGNVQLAKNASAYAEVKKMFGDVKSNVTYSLGARWNF